MKRRYILKTSRKPTRRLVTKEKVLNDIVPQLVCTSKHAKAKPPKRRREKREPIGEGRELIKANPLQKDPQFIKDLANGQHRYRQYFNAAKANTDFSDVKILECFITDNDIVIGIFKDAEYELGWGFYFIKGKKSCTRIITTGRAETLKFGVIPCRELEEAVAMSQLYGDIKDLN